MGIKSHPDYSNGYFAGLCNGEQGTCLIDDTPKAIAQEIREYAATLTPLTSS